MQLDDVIPTGKLAQVDRTRGNELLQRSQKPNPVSSAFRKSLEITNAVQYLLQSDLLVVRTQL